ncbi:MAG TPA: 3-isopropylmalate dehydrogenase [Thermomicrobiaceae bacterium]|nr:3-isopropylmalate dehydrogenase [Thermomicrobiaceae bacterium]
MTWSTPTVGSVTSNPARVAVVGGDGIGPEVVDEALKVLKAAGVQLKFSHYNLGIEPYLRTGEVLPAETLNDLAASDAILLGAIGPPVNSTEVPPGLLERGIVLALRFQFDLYINYRPFHGGRGSKALGAEFVIIRENTEGPYSGSGGVLRYGTPFEVATQGSINTRMGVERCLEFAFQQAYARQQQLTLVHKTNVLEYAGNLWLRVFRELQGKYPSVPCEYNHADAACMYLVEDPHRYEIVVTDNLFGDLLTDVAAAVTGGLGCAASANLDPTGTHPSLFEPAHGAAHDLAGKGLANPLAAIHAAALMLDHLGYLVPSRKILNAVATVKEVLGGRSPTLSTKAVGDLVAEEVSNAL